MRLQGKTVLIPGASRQIPTRNTDTDSILPFSTEGEAVSDTLANLSRPRDLQSVVRSMKALAAASIG